MGDFTETEEFRRGLEEGVKQSIKDLIDGGYSCNDPEAGEIIVEKLRNDPTVPRTCVERILAKKRALGGAFSAENLRQIMRECILEYMSSVEENLEKSRKNPAEVWAGIAEEAKRRRNACREEYAHCVPKTSIYKDENGKDKKMHFEEGKPKCNLFVFDVLNGVGIKAPLNWSGKWPFTAADWHGTTESRFETLDSRSPMQPGDIVATTSHCGIAVDNTYVIAAGVHKVTLDTREKQSLKEGSIIRRYKQ